MPATKKELEYKRLRREAIKKSCLLGFACACVFIFLSTATSAALINNGGGLIYDTVLNITWAQLEDFKEDGHCSWAVHAGNVVPVPAAVWLFGPGLLGLIGIAGKKRHKNE